MGRKRTPLKPGRGLHLSIRLDASIAQRLDHLVDKMAADTRLPVSRADVVRLLLEEALDARGKPAK